MPTEQGVQCWEYNQEIIEPTPKCIRTVCEAAGKDGWELASMLAVMLPPKAKQQQRQLSSGLYLAETVPEDDVSAALAVKMAEQDSQPTPAVLLMFKRPEQCS